MPDRAHSAGLLVLDRFNWFSEESPIRPRKEPVPVIALSNAEITERYRGIDGDGWPQGPGLDEIRQAELYDYRLGFGGVAPLDQFEKVFAYYREVSKNRLCDLVFIDFPWRSGPSVEAPTGFSFCGHDYGMFESTTTHYPCIFHEVIYGQDEELIAMAKELNDCLLLPSMALVDRLVMTRQRLIEARVPLEIESEWFPYEAIAVYAYPRLHGPR